MCLPELGFHGKGYEIENYAQDYKLTLIYLLCNDLGLTVTVEGDYGSAETFWTEPPEPAKKDCNCP